MQTETKTNFVESIIDYTLHYVYKNIVKNFDWDCINQTWCLIENIDNISPCISGMRINALIGLILPHQDNLTINIFEDNNKTYFCFYFCNKEHFYFPIYTQDSGSLLSDKICCHGRTVVKNLTSSSNQRLIYANYANFKNAKSLNIEDIERNLNKSGVNLIELRYFQLILGTTIRCATNEDKLKKTLTALLLLRPDIYIWLSEDNKKNTSYSPFYNEIINLIKNFANLSHGQLKDWFDNNISFFNEILKCCGKLIGEICNDSLWMGIREIISNKLYPLAPLQSSSQAIRFDK